MNLKTMIKQRRDREELYATAEYWDGKADALEGAAVSMWPNNHLNALYHEEQLSFVLEHFPSVENRDLLDLGCGTGRLSRWFADRGARVTGLDFSAGALRIAEAATEGDNPTYRCESMLDLEDEDCYDLIFCWGSVAIACRNADELADVMRRLKRSLHPGGALLLLEPIHKGPLHRVLNMGLREFTAVMSASGFEVRSVRALHFWPMRLALAYIPWPAFITVPLYHAGQLLMRLPGLRSAGDYQGILAVARGEA